MADRDKAVQSYQYVADVWRHADPELQPYVTEAREGLQADDQRVAMIVHVLDGTYELFRHFYGQRRFNKGKDKPYGAVAGVLHTVLEMIEQGATHLGVATDHVIESFRNDLWPEYKTGEGIERALWAQFHPLEEALAAMGVAVWPMVELEADDALASAARLAAEDERVEQVCIWANDKDLAQCVRWTTEWSRWIGGPRRSATRTRSARSTASSPR